MKSYPEFKQLMISEMDNLAVWVNGNERYSYGDDHLEGLINNKVRKLEMELDEIKEKLRRYHTKTVKGKKYWYVVENGKWVYKGSDDPRNDLFKREKQIEAEKKTISKRIRTCVVMTVGDHVIIDIKTFRKVTEQKLPENSFKLSKIMRKIWKK